MEPLPARIALPCVALAAIFGCVGQVTLTPDEEVTPGAALGFDDINYVRTDRALGFPLTSIMVIETDGRTIHRFSDGQSARAGPIRFLTDDELFELRRAFAASDFFSFSDSTYGTFDQQTTRLTQSIVYQVGGVSEELRRHDEAEVPASIEPLFDLLEKTLAEGEFDVGDSTLLAAVIEGRMTRIDERQFVVIKSDDALLDLLFRVGSNEISVLPRLDYSREMLVGAFLGDDAGVTGSIRFEPIAYREAGRLKVRYVRRDVPPGCDERVRPFALARVPRADVPVVFFEASERDTARCGG